MVGFQSSSTRLEILGKIYALFARVFKFYGDEKVPSNFKNRELHCGLACEKISHKQLVSFELHNITIVKHYPKTKADYSLSKFLILNSEALRRAKIKLERPRLNNKTLRKRNCSKAAINSEKLLKIHPNFKQLAPKFHEAVVRQVYACE